MRSMFFAIPATHRRQANSTSAGRVKGKLAALVLRTLDPTGLLVLTQSGGRRAKDAAGRGSRHGFISFPFSTFSTTTTPKVGRQANDAGGDDVPSVSHVGKNFPCSFGGVCD